MVRTRFSAAVGAALLMGAMANAAPTPVSNVVFTLGPPAAPETNRLNLSLIADTETVTAGLSGTIGIDLTFDPTTNQITAMNVVAGLTEILATDGTFLLLEGFLDTFVDIEGLGLTLGDFSDPPNIGNGPVLSPIGVNEFDAAFNFLIINQGVFIYDVPALGENGTLDFGAEPVGFEIPVDPVTTIFFTNNTAVNGIDPTLIDVTSTIFIPIIVSTELDLGTLTLPATIVSTIVAFANFQVVVPEPSVFALFGVAGAVGVVSYRVRRQKKAASKLEAVA